MKAIRQRELREQRILFIINSVDLMRNHGIRPTQHMIHRLVYFMKHLLHQKVFQYKFIFTSKYHGVYSEELSEDISWLTTYEFLGYQYPDSSNYGPHLVILPPGKKKLLQIYQRNDSINFILQLFSRDIDTSLQKVSLMLFLFRHYITFEQNGKLVIDKDNMKEQFLKFKPKSESQFKITLDTLLSWFKQYDNMKQEAIKKRASSILQTYLEGRTQYQKVSDFIQDRYLEKNHLNKRYCYCDEIRQYDKDSISFYVYQSRGGYSQTIDWDEGYPKPLYMWQIAMSQSEWKHYIQKLEMEQRQLKQERNKRDLERQKQKKYKQYLELQKQLKDMNMI